MDVFTKYFSKIALIGLLLSAFFHLISLTGTYLHGVFDVGMPLMHVGVFVVFFPAILKINKLQRGGSSNLTNRSIHFTQKQYLQYLKNNRPKFFVALGILLFVYALVNFVLFAQAGGGGGPHITDQGVYVIQNHGDIIREITEKEYWQFRANEIRGFSGHWLAFYFVSYFLLYKSDIEILDLYPTAHEQ